MPELGAQHAWTSSLNPGSGLAVVEDEDVNVRLVVGAIRAAERSAGKTDDRPAVVDGDGQQHSRFGHGQPRRALRKFQILEAVRNAMEFCMAAWAACNSLRAIADSSISR